MTVKPDYQMAKKSLAVIILEHQGKSYKVNTISVSNDGSVHIFNNLPKENSEYKRANPHKYTYHPNGYTHFTEGHGESKEEVFPKTKLEKTKITDTIGLSMITLQRLKSKQIDYLEEFKPAPKYKHVISIDARRYNNLTIKYFLAASQFDTQRSSHLYEEVFEVPLDDGKILIATINSNTPTEFLALHM